MAGPADVLRAAHRGDQLLDKGSTRRNTGRRIGAGPRAATTAIEDPQMVAGKETIAAVRGVLDRFAAAYAAKDIAGVLGCFDVGTDGVRIGTGADEWRVGSAEVRAPTDRRGDQVARWLEDRPVPPLVPRGGTGSRKLILTRARVEEWSLRH